MRWRLKRWPRTRRATPWPDRFRLVARSVCSSPIPASPRSGSSVKRTTRSPNDPLPGPRSHPGANTSRAPAGGRGLPPRRSGSWPRPRCARGRAPGRLAHGHLVPPNIILAPGRLRVTDFGLWALRPRRIGTGRRAPSPSRAGLPGAARPPQPPTCTRSGGVPGLPGQRRARRPHPRPGDSPAARRASRAATPATDQRPSATRRWTWWASLAALWAACLGPKPAERPSAAHAAVMSRQARPAAGPRVLVGRPKARPATGQGRGPGRGYGFGPGPVPSNSRPRPGTGGWRRRRKETPPAAVTVGGAATVATAAAGVGMCWPLHPRRGRPARPRPPRRGDQPAGRGRAARPAPGCLPPNRRHRCGHLHPNRQADPAVPAGRDQPAVPDHRRGCRVRAGPAGRGVDFDNLIQPVKTELAAGQPAPVTQLATTLREKLWTRVSEGAVTVSAATVLNDEITALAHSASTT